MCLNETCNSVRVGKNLSNMFPTKNSLKTTRCFRAIAFQLCFRVGNQEGSGKPGWLEIKWYSSGLVYADDVNILGGSVRTVQEKTESLNFVDRASRSLLLTGLLDTHPPECVIPDDVLIQFGPPDDERLQLETCKGMK